MRNCYKRPSRTAFRGPKTATLPGPERQEHTSGGYGRKSARCDRRREHTWPRRAHAHYGLSAGVTSSTHVRRLSRKRQLTLRTCETKWPQASERPAGWVRAKGDRNPGRDGAAPSAHGDASALSPCVRPRSRGDRDGDWGSALGRLPVQQEPLGECRSSHSRGCGRCRAGVGGAEAGGDDPKEHGEAFLKDVDSQLGTERRTGLCIGTVQTEGPVFHCSDMYAPGGRGEE